MYPNVHCTAMFICSSYAPITIARTWKQPICHIYIYVCMCVCVYTYTHAHTHTMEYYSALKRSKSESVVVRWKNLEPVIQSEVSQKQKNKYHMLIHIYGIQKNNTDEPIYREEMETQAQRTDLLTQEGKARVEQIKKVALDPYTLLCVKQVIGRKLYSTGSPAWCSVTTWSSGM